MSASVEYALRHAERLQKTGELHGARRVLQDTAIDYPDDARILQALTGLALEEDDIAAEISRLQELLPASKSPQTVLNQLGILYSRTGQHAEAIHFFREAVRIAPDYAPAHSNLGNAHKALRDWSSAINCHRRAVALAADKPDLLYNLGLTLLQSGAFEEAEPPLRAALALKPGNNDIINELGILLCRTGRPQEAVSLLTDATSRHPDIVQGWVHLGHALIDAGRPAAGLEAYGRALQLDPDCLPAQIGRLHYSRQSIDSPLIPYLTRRMNDPAEAPESRVSAAFGLGKVWLDCNRTEEAFAAYVAGNDLHASLHPPAPDHANRLQTLRKLDQKHFERFTDKSPGHSHPRLPVLIVGMPRSGKSLCESLLSGHPAVHAAGELNTLQNQIKTLFRSAEETDLGDHSWRRAGAEALIEALPGSGDHTRIIYTLPGHLWILHQLAALLPEAPVVYCRRDPFDLAIANYFKHFANGNLFSYQMDTLGREIRQFQLLMEHWQSVLPNPGLVIDYEDLVTRPEAIARQLCAHTGLSWSEQCLVGLQQPNSFTDALGPAGSIDTPSPIRKDFVGISSRFRDNLHAFHIALEEKDVTVPDRDATLIDINDQLTAGNVHGMLSLLRQMLERYPGDLALQTLHARACSLLGQDVEAISSFEQLMAQVDLSSPSTTGLKREYVEALLRAQQHQAAGEALSKLVLPAPIHDRLRLKHALACGSRTPELTALALEHLKDSGAQDAEALSLYASLDSSSQSPALHKRALDISPNAERWLRAAERLDGEARSEALWQAAQIKPVSRVSVTAYAQLREHLAVTHPALSRLHDVLHELWAGYREERLEQPFGDFGLPYQSLESIRLPGTRPTAFRLQTYGIQRWLAPNARALDIGCNHGFLLLALADQLSSGVGFDISQTCVAVGQTVATLLGKQHIDLRHQTYHAFMESVLDSGDTGFDLIIACAVHRWIEMPLPVFGNALHRLLNPGGLVLVESQGRRSRQRIEDGFEDTVMSMADNRFRILHRGTICDDALNLRGFFVLQRYA